MPQLRFGISLPMADARLSARDLMAEIVEEALAAEEAGFDLCLFPEHHHGPRGSLTDPMAVVSWLLARTGRIAVGTGVLLLPLYDAVHVAEWSALLHEASGKRLVLGVGAGYRSEDFARFGVDRAQRSELLGTKMDRIRDVWGEGGGPPMWLGAWSREGVSRAATAAEGWIADPVRTVQQVAETANVYGAEAAVARRSPVIAVMREAWVAETDEAARVEYAPAAESVYRYYQRGGAPVADGGADHRPSICGSPATLVAGLDDLVRRTRATWCILTLRHPGGPPHDAVLRAIRWLALDVLPAVRAGALADVEPA